MARALDTQVGEQRRVDLLERLEEEVLSLRRSEAWARYLSCQARFHRYSPRNVMLIALQRPDATSVAGYRTWSSLGRQVRRDERGISILAPMLRRCRPEDEAQLTGFRWVTVFDITQTEGDPLPSPVRLLDGVGPTALTDRLGAAAATFGFSIELGALPAGVNGECRWATATIVLAAQNAPLQQAKTLAHELGHVLLHRHDPDRARAEIEAEAVAYLVLAASGADAAPYSAGYLSSWIGADADPSAAIQRSCEAIHRASSAILEAVDTRHEQP
jgi:hypothetical protein